MQADTVERSGAALLLKYEFIDAMSSGEHSRISDGGESSWWRWRLRIRRGSQARGEGYGRQEQINRKASITNADVHTGIQLAVVRGIQNAEPAPADRACGDVDRPRLACETG